MFGLKAVMLDYRKINLNTLIEREYNISSLRRVSIY